MAGGTAAKFFSRTFDRHRNDRGHKRTLLFISHFGLDLQSVSRVQLPLRLLPGPELLEVVLESFILAVNFPAFLCALLLGANSECARSAAFWGALLASSAWNLSTALFSLYLRSGFSRYELIYGSVGALVAFLFLIYILATVTLFGAHLAAAIDRKSKLNQVTGSAIVTEDVKG